MKLKVSALFAAYLTLAAIINEKRELPQKGKYRVARMHDKLAGEFKTASAARDDLIKQFGKELEDEQGNKTGAWMVPPGSENWAAYTEAWDKLGNDEIEVEVQPIPLDSLGDGGSIEAFEFLALGDLVVDAA